MPAVNEVEAKLITQLALMGGLDGAALSGDLNIKELGMDSMRLVELFVFVEKDLGLELMNSSIGAKDMETIGSLATFIADHTD